MKRDTFEALLVGLIGALIAAAVYLALWRVGERLDVHIVEDAGCTTDEECCARHPQLDPTLCGGAE